MKIYHYCVNTFDKNDNPVQLEGGIAAYSEDDAIKRLADNGVICPRSYEFLELVETTDWLIDGLSKQHLAKEKEKAMKWRVKVICPKCGARMLYKNWFSWVWHNPFHWFGKRRTQCSNCYEYSWMKRERSNKN